jgi:hypothetical protein
MYSSIQQEEEEEVEESYVPCPSLLVFGVFNVA